MEIILILEEILAVSIFRLINDCTNNGNGLTLNIVSDILSKPYIKMTLDLMTKMGVKHTWNNTSITVKNQTYIGANFSVENDWSGASFWYSFAALADSAENSPTLFIQSIRTRRLIRQKHI